jgi:hypothetical protein
MRKTIYKLVKERMCLNIIKAIYENSTAKLKPNSGNFKAFPLRSTQEHQLLPLSSKESRSPSQTRERNKRYPKQKGRSKIYCIYRQHMISLLCGH